MVEEIARWKELTQGSNPKLIYIQPNMVKDGAPVINPLVISGVDAEDYSDKARQRKIVVAQELTKALAIIAAESGSADSGIMKTIIERCVLVLLNRRGSTLRDLMTFMDQDANQELVAFACGLDKYPRLVDYFGSNRFSDKGNGSSKAAIGRRLDEILTDGAFERMTCGGTPGQPNNINLEEALNTRKVILFDLGKGAIGERQGSALGRLMLAMILEIILRRGQSKSKNPVPCAIIADECHNYTSESMSTILTETRKYRCTLLLAQQMAGQGMTQQLKEAVLGTTNIQIVGGSPLQGSATNGALIGAGVEDIRTLEQGEFYVRPNRQGKLIKFKNRTGLLDNSRGVGDLMWKSIKAQQARKYYQTTLTAPTSDEEEEPDISSR